MYRALLVAEFVHPEEASTVDNNNKAVRINPLRRTNTLTDDEFAAIWAESVRLLRIGVRTGRIICTDPAEIGRPRARMTREDAVYVYHREHCRRCGTELLTVELAGRPLQYCPTCQPA